MSCAACGAIAHNLSSCEDPAAVPVYRKHAVAFRARGGTLWERRAADADRKADALERRLAANAEQRKADDAAMQRARDHAALARRST